MSPLNPGVSGLRYHLTLHRTIGQNCACSQQLLYSCVLQLLLTYFKLADTAANFTDGAGDWHTAGGVSGCLPRADTQLGTGRVRAETTRPSCRGHPKESLLGRGAALGGRGGSCGTCRNVLWQVGSLTEGKPNAVEAKAVYGLQEKSQSLGKRVFLQMTIGGLL